jgi:hypothetical protein
LNLSAGCYRSQAVTTRCSGNMLLCTARYGSGRGEKTLLTWLASKVYMPRVGIGPLYMQFCRRYFRGDPPKEMHLFRGAICKVDLLPGGYSP